MLNWLRRNMMIQQRLTILKILKLSAGISVRNIFISRTLFLIVKSRAITIYVFCGVSIVTTSKIYKTIWFWDRILFSSLWRNSVLVSLFNDISTLWIESKISLFKGFYITGRLIWFIIRDFLQNSILDKSG